MEIGKVTRVKRFSAIVDDKSADNSDDPAKPLCNDIYISWVDLFESLSMPERVKLDKDMSEFSVFKSCADNYYYTRARFHHSQPIAIFEFTYIK